MRGLDYSNSTEFLANLFSYTEHAVEIRALPNKAGAGSNRPLFGRTPALIEAHCRKWDDLDRAVYFGVCTRDLGSPSGTRADVVECPALWVDIDTLKMGLYKNQVTRQLSTMLACKPTAIVDSGGGLHAYWKLKEPLQVRLGEEGTPDTEAAIIATLKQLVGVLAGDINVCDLARILRLPGSHNTKSSVIAANRGEPFLVTVIDADWSRVYDFEEIVDWLDYQRPVVSVPLSLMPDPVKAEMNPYLAAAASMGFKSPIDVKKALSCMTLGGTGDTSIHQTQLVVSASLGRQGIAEDEIVSVLLDATRAAAGKIGDRWNWTREESNLRGMIRSAAKKYSKPAIVPPVPPIAAAHTDAVSATGTDGRVVSIKAEREKRQPKNSQGEEKDQIIAKIGDAVMAYWLDNRGPMIVIGGEPWSYKDGYWTQFDSGLEHALRVSIQGVIKVFNSAPTGSLRSSVYAYIIEHQDLHRESGSIRWDAHGLVIGINGCINPITGEVHPHSPDHYATFRIETTIDPAAQCPIWIGFLRAALQDQPEQAEKIISTVGEVFGSFLIRGKRRELTKALFVHGKSRTGKSQLALVARDIVGGRISGIRARDLNEHFGPQALIGKTGWIADDAVGENEYMDAEWFKLIVDGAPVSIPRKGLSAWDGTLDMPVLMTMNHLPRARDQSGAVFNRALVLPFNLERAESDPGNIAIAKEVSENELGGVLNWAIEGWKRLYARGHYDPPTMMVKALKNYAANNRPVASWVDCAVECDSSFMIDRRDVLASFNGWLALEFGAEGKQWGGRSLFPAIRNLLPQIDDHGSNGARYITGIKLTSEGINCWQQYLDSRTGTISTTSTRETVNRMAPEKPVKKTTSGKFTPQSLSKTVF